MSTAGPWIVETRSIGATPGSGSSTKSFCDLRSPGCDTLADADANPRLRGPTRPVRVTVGRTSPGPTPPLYVQLAKLGRNVSSHVHPSVATTTSASKSEPEK